MTEFQDSDLVTVAFKQPSELRRTRPNHEDDSFKQRSTKSTSTTVSTTFIMKLNHFQFNSCLSPPNPESKSAQLYTYCKEGEKGDKERGGGGAHNSGPGGGPINGSTIKRKSPQPVR